MSKCPICNATITAQARSIPQHRRFFGVLRAAYHHFPEIFAEFQPESEEHLRAYLLVKTGHHTVHTIDIQNSNVDQLVTIIQAALRAAGSYAFVQPDGDHVKIFKPKSIAFHRLSPSEFTALNTRVEEVYRELGIDPDTVLREYENAA